MMRKTSEPALLEASESFSSAWIDEHGTGDFPSGVCRKGTLVRAGHPIVKAHHWLFVPAQADVGDRRPI